MDDRLLTLLGVEPLVALSVMVLAVTLIYKILLRDAKASRHETLRRLLKELYYTHLVFMGSWLIQYLIAHNFQAIFTAYHYFGTAAVIMGSVVFVRAIKILVFEYLFLSNMSAGVPVLLVNLVTLLISIFIAAWLSTAVFGVLWAPLLATSAIVSVVLGLALQDTLGNLFAGVALQFDKPYQIGDWIELRAGSETFVGEVFEITWRATTLYGIYDEVLTLPNRMVAQSEVSNFSARKKPISRGLTVILDASADEQQVKAIFKKVLSETPGVIQDLEHLVMLRDLSEKGAHWRLFYPIVHYGKQFTIVDEILMRSQAEFKKAGIQIARIRVEGDNALSRSGA